MHVRVPLTIAWIDSHAAFHMGIARSGDMYAGGGQHCEAPSGLKVNGAAPASQRCMRDQTGNSVIMRMAFICMCLGGMSRAPPNHF